jgi:hypothetical protein
MLGPADVVVTELTDIPSVDGAPLILKLTGTELVPTVNSPELDCTPSLSIVTTPLLNNPEIVTSATPVMSPVTLILPVPIISLLFKSKSPPRLGLVSFTISGQQADYNQSVKHETKCILYMKPMILW